MELEAHVTGNIKIQMIDSMIASNSARNDKVDGVRNSSFGHKDADAVSGVYPHRLPTILNGPTSCVWSAKPSVNRNVQKSLSVIAKNTPSRHEIIVISNRNRLRRLQDF